MGISKQILQKTSKEEISSGVAKSWILSKIGVQVEGIKIFKLGLDEIAFSEGDTIFISYWSILKYVQ